jgi:hypothetical protein
MGGDGQSLGACIEVDGTQVACSLTGSDTGDNGCVTVVTPCNNGDKVCSNPNHIFLCIASHFNQNIKYFKIVYIIIQGFTQRFL